jgi:hypothetical protein
MISLPFLKFLCREISRDVREGEATNSYAAAAQQEAAFWQELAGVNAALKGVKAGLKRL